MGTKLQEISVKRKKTRTTASETVKEHFMSSLQTWPITSLMLNQQC